MSSTTLHLTEPQRRNALQMSPEDRAAHVERLLITAADLDRKYSEAAAKEEAGTMLLIPSDHYAQQARFYRELAIEFAAIQTPTRLRDIPGWPR